MEGTEDTREINIVIISNESHYNAETGKYHVCLLWGSISSHMQMTIPG